MSVGLLVGVASLALATPAWAVRPGAPKGVAETTCTTGSGGRRVVKSVRGGYIHAASMICPIAPCNLTLFDSDSSTTGTGTVKWEARARDNNETYSQAFKSPLVTENGIAYEVDVSSTVCVAWE